MRRFGRRRRPGRASGYQRRRSARVHRDRDQQGHAERIHEHQLRDLPGWVRTTETVTSTIAEQPVRGVADPERANGTISFSVSVPGPGGSMSWRPLGMTISRGRDRAGPASHRFVYARAQASARAAGDLQLKVRPGARGRRLVAHHRCARLGDAGPRAQRQRWTFAGRRPAALNVAPRNLPPRPSPPTQCRGRFRPTQT